MQLLKPFRLIYLLLGTVVTVSLASIKGIVARPKGMAYGKYLLYTTVWALQKFDSKRKVRGGWTTTVAAYTEALKKSPSTSPRATPLDYGAQLLWLGPEKPAKVLYYLHGGGYVENAVLGHIVVLQRIVEKAQGKGISLGASILVYGLAPKDQYPRQLKQAAAGLKSLLNDLQIKLSDISIAGDSAGGNLALALASHISHPHPEVEAIIPSLPTSAGLGGLFLISPWVTFSQTAASFQSNSGKDYLQVANLASAAAEFMGGRETDNYNTPLDADAAWWEGLPARSVSILAGEWELFVSDIEYTAEKMKVKNPGVTYVVVPREVHVQAAFNATVGWAPAESEEVFGNWVVAAAQA